MYRPIYRGRHPETRFARYGSGYGDGSDSGVLDEMYKSAELYDQGLLSFHYPLYQASDEELEQFLGKLVSSVGHAASGIANTAGQAVKTVGKAINTVEK